jgi:hypothetical protein
LARAAEHGGMKYALPVAITLLCLAITARVDAGPAAKAQAWQPAAAARYLDARMTWWQNWPKAQRDHGTACVSCHTALPFALARPVLRRTLGESARGPVEQQMLDDVVKRVWLWKEVDPFYLDQKAGLPKSSESRASEAVLNALILVARDAESGHMGRDTRQAFANMWPLQMQTGDLKGGFPWLNFRLEPWESSTAPYWGATLAAIAVGRAPDGYAASPDITPQVEALRAYLRGGAGAPSLYTRMLILWADSQLHGVLDPAQRQAITDALIAAQGKDGGWSLTRLSDWQRIDGSRIEDAGDGMATAMIALALRNSGMATSAPPLQAARGWLAIHQDKAGGGVPAKSINKDRDPKSDPYLFMTDAATGYAVLAMQP